MNPYWGKNFFEFFILLGKRMGLLAQGSLSFNDLATDELQIGILLCIAISSVLVGTFLVLKKMTMLANSLSHTVLCGIILACIITRTHGDIERLSITTLLIASLITALGTVMLTHFLTRFLKVQEDASIGLVFTTLFALGLVCITLYTRNTHIGTDIIMGNVDALHPDDWTIAFFTLLGNLLITVLFFHTLRLLSFDNTFALSIGIKSCLFQFLLITQTAATSIGAFRAVGVLLVLAFLVGPVLTARLITHHLPSLLIGASIFGSLASICGVALSRHLLSIYHMPLSTSALVVTLIACIYLLILAFKSIPIQKRAPE